ncbi:hypothetical protein D3C74_30270 [compost metagenome]
MKVWLFLLFFALAWTFMGLAFALIGVLRKSKARQWPSTGGVIIKKGELGKDVSDRCPTVQYLVNAVQYEHTSSVRHPPGFKPGTPVSVRYDPEQPERAIIDTIAQNGTIFARIGYIFLATGLVLALIAAAFAWSSM